MTASHNEQLFVCLLRWFELGVDNFPKISEGISNDNKTFTLSNAIRGQETITIQYWNNTYPDDISINLKDINGDQVKTGEVNGIGVMNFRADLSSTWSFKVTVTPRPGGSAFEMSNTIWGYRISVTNQNPFYSSPRVLNVSRAGALDGTTVR